MARLEARKTGPAATALGPMLQFLSILTLGRRPVAAHLPRSDTASPIPSVADNSRQIGVACVTSRHCGSVLSCTVLPSEGE
jgi:hypothetical protein